MLTGSTRRRRRRQRWLTARNASGWAAKQSLLIA